MKETSLTKNAIGIIQRIGQSPLAEASKKILSNRYDDGILCEALHYYAQEVLPNVLPIFPALMALSSRAVGAIPENSQSISIAMLLITSSGDIHDDIVDNSKEKFTKKTLFGKYGKDIALLAGDLLLIQGMTVLQNECSNLSAKQRKTIANSIAEAMLEIVKAEALEISLWHKSNVTPEEFFEVIQLKGGVAEFHCKLGGIVGGGSMVDIENLSNYGRTIGVLSTIKEEFMDMTCSSELSHRIKHELPPFPALCAMQNKTLNEKLVNSKNAGFSLADLEEVSTAVMGSFEVEKLTTGLKEFGRKELLNNQLLKGNARSKELVVLLEALTEELELV